MINIDRPHTNITMASSISKETDLFRNYYLYRTEVLTTRFPTMLEASLHSRLRRVRVITETRGLATLNKIHFDMLSSYWGLSELGNGLFLGHTGISVYFLIIVLKIYSGISSV